jgi:hypothetical protein
MFEMENMGISLEILGMKKWEAQDYCRQRGISCAFLETGAPDFSRSSGKTTIDKVIRAALGADSQTWELLTAPFEDPRIDEDANAM